MVICLDFGHGCGRDRGAVGVIAEETIINAVGLVVCNKLRNLGHTVVLTRPNGELSVSDSLNARISASNANNADLFISIHANAGGGVGTEVFTYGGKLFDEAANVLNNIVSLGFTNRGIKDGSNLAVVRGPKAKSMLIEVCFVDTQSDVDKYNSVGAEAIGNAIFKGIIGYTTPIETKGYVVTNYLPHASDYDGVDINAALQYFEGIKCYVRGNAKGVWIETQYLDIAKCEELKKTLGSWFYSIEK